MIEFTIALLWEDVLAGVAIYVAGMIVAVGIWGIASDSLPKPWVLWCSVWAWPVFWSLFLVGCALRIPIAVSRSME